MPLKALVAGFPWQLVVARVIVPALAA